MNPMKLIFRPLARLLGAAALVSLSAQAANIDLADAPLFSSVSVPGNLALVLSVEYPTGIAPAYPSTTAYASTTTFLGYFDPEKCYRYVVTSDETKSYFEPYGSATDHACTSNNSAASSSSSSSAKSSSSSSKASSSSSKTSSSSSKASSSSSSAKASSSSSSSSSTGVALWSGNYLNWAAMQSLDAFRWVLTGGARYPESNDDSAAQTILEKANNPAQGTHASNTPDKSITGSTLISGATPLSNFSTVITRTWGTGTYMLVSNSTSSLSATATTIPAGAVAYDGSTGTSGAIYRLYIRVKVCVAGQLESNCVGYPLGSASPTVYKPEGLMQTYQDKLRYSAFGYLNGDSDKDTYNNGIVKKDGAAMRARMKFIGPTAPVPGSSALSNDNAEWSSTTGIMSKNPDPTDAAAASTLAGETVSYSGAMNYLNLFGKVTEYPSGKGYRHYDSVGELYYTALRYLRGLGNVSSYTDLSTNVDSTFTKLQTLDGFPAITSWDDPMVWGVTSGGVTTTRKTYACQKNFILGLGDVNIQYDANVPGGGSSAARKSGYEPSMPSEVAADAWASSNTLNAVTSTNMVGQLEGLGALGTKNQTSVTSQRVVGSGNGTNFIAGMAYAAHTSDIRPDQTSFPGTQTVNTYWLDVQEYQYYVSKNIYWLATKYGGFDIPSGFDPFSTSNSSRTLPDSTWTAGDLLTNSYNSSISDKRPSNYFVGSSPNTMKSSLTSAFAKIASEAGEATATALAAPSPKQTSSGGANYVAAYDPSNWTGTLKGQTASYDSSGNPTYTDVWNAHTLLNARSYTTRQIVTWCGSTGVAFNTSMSCTASFAAVEGVSTQSAANYIAYLRGDRTQERANGGAYRTRSSLLGDIVNAKVVASGSPDGLLGDRFNPGYSAYKRSYASRETVVFVGANDGMMHAFNGSVTSADRGKELFAYIPGLIYSDTNPPLSSLGNPSFTHRYLVDGTPDVFDVDFSRAGTALTSASRSSASSASSASSSAAANDWRTILVGGLGKGGKGYYAIDVTDPSAWTSESAVAGKVLWEFSNTHMGYSYGRALVVKTAKYGWVAVLTSGYNNDDGKGYFFFVNPSTGALLETVATSEGSTSSPLNMAHASAFVPDYKDGTADAVYAGDLQGNVWRLDLTGTSGTYASPTRLATLRSPDGTAQPVTTRPLIEIDPSSSKRYVLVGTGRLLADSDISSSQVQSFYAMIDGKSDSGAFYGGTTSLPSGISFPLTRSALEANSSLGDGIGSSPAKVMGWYFDLPVSSSVAERVSVDPAYNNGIVAWAGNLPNGEVCSPSGTSHVYAVGLALGKSVLTDSSGLVAYLSQNSVVTELGFVNVDGKTRLLAGTSGGSVVNLPGSFSAATSLKRMNWRMVPTVD